MESASDTPDDGPTSGAAARVPAGRRERKKLATRIAISRVAMRLFSQKGFRATRISEIAQAADVSESTFFRYFEGKEGVALEGFRQRAEAIVEAVAARPVSERPIQACLAVGASPGAAAFRPTASDLPEIQLLQHHPELAPKLMILVGGLLARLTTDFARRLDAAPEALEVRLQAHAVIAAGVAVLEAWIADPTIDPIAYTVHALRRLEAGLR